MASAVATISGVQWLMLWHFQVVSFFLFSHRGQCQDAEAERQIYDKAEEQLQTAQASCS